VAIDLPSGYTPPPELIGEPVKWCTVLVKNKQAPVTTRPQSSSTVAPNPGHYYDGDDSSDEKVEDDDGPTSYDSDNCHGQPGGGGDDGVVEMKGEPPSPDPRPRGTLEARQSPRSTPESPPGPAVGELRKHGGMDEVAAGVTGQARKGPVEERAAPGGAGELESEVGT
jgi:hypothetical protein